jgi:hypothetical protein
MEILFFPDSQEQESRMEESHPEGFYGSGPKQGTPGFHSDLWLQLSHRNPLNCKGAWKM